MIRKKGKLSTSHRYNLLSLLSSDPGEVGRELVVYDFPVTKVAIFHKIATHIVFFEGKAPAVTAENL